MKYTFTVTWGIPHVLHVLFNPSHVKKFKHVLTQVKTENETGVSMPTLSVLIKVECSMLVEWIVDAVSYNITYGT
jgi:hypothetical protein